MYATPETDARFSELMHQFGDVVRTREPKKLVVVIGVVLEFVGILIPIFALTLSLAVLVAYVTNGASHGSEMRATGLLLLIVYVASAVISYPLLRISAACLAAYETATSMRVDAPVALYLRPFRADAEALGDVLHSLAFAIFGHFAWHFTVDSRRPSKDPEKTGLRDSWNVETLLCQVAAPWRLVAIGRPGESFQKPGAARLYVDQERWMAVVSELMIRADIIVVRLSGYDGKGVEWELETLRKSNCLHKTILLTLDQQSNPLGFHAVSRILQLAGLGDVVSAFSANQRQQAVYHADNRWRSILIDQLKNPLGNLKIAIQCLRLAHPVFQIWSSKERSAPAQNLPSIRRVLSVCLALVLSLASIGSFALKLKADRDAALRRSDQELACLRAVQESSCRTDLECALTARRLNCRPTFTFGK